MASNVRIQAESYAKLRELAERNQTSLPKILSEAIDELYRKRFFEDCDQAYDRLKANPKAWQEELDERAAWDCTLSDGLEDT